MRKITLALAFLFAGFLAVKAQSLQITQYDSVVVGDANTTTDLYSISIVKNVSSIPVEVAFKRIDKNYNTLTDSNAICWGLCFTTDISVSPPAFNKVLQPGESDTASTHVYPKQDGYTREGDITYVFFDYYNPNDTASYTVTYKVDGIPLSLNEASAKTDLNVYPNPARDLINLNYHLPQGAKGEFEIINLAGSKVISRSLRESSGNLQISISELPGGVYFYHLKANGKAIKTKKLIVE